MKIDVEFNTNSLTETIFISGKKSTYDICSSFLEILSLNLDKLENIKNIDDTSSFRNSLKSISSFKHINSLLFLGDYKNITEWFTLSNVDLKIVELKSKLDVLNNFLNKCDSADLSKSINREIRFTKQEIRHLTSFKNNRSRFISTVIDLLLNKIKIYRYLIELCYFTTSSHSNFGEEWDNIEPLKKFYLSTLVLGDKIKPFTNIPKANIIFDETLKYSEEDIENISITKFMPRYRYSCYTLDDFLQISFLTILLNNYKVKQCENCGKYFIALQRSDEKYCNRISPQNIEKTCKQYAITENWKNNLQSDNCLLLYRQLYMRKQMQARRNPNDIHIQRQFEKWKTEAKYMRNKYAHGNISQKTFLNWLYNN